MAKLNASVHQLAQPIGPGVAAAGGDAHRRIAVGGTDISVHAADHAREQKVTVVPSWPAMAASQQGLLLAVPVPDVASAGGGSDGSVVIYDELNDTVYDFWQFKRDPSRARCR